MSFLRFVGPERLITDETMLDQLASDDGGTIWPDMAHPRTSSAPTSSSFERVAAQMKDPMPAPFDAVKTRSRPVRSTGGPDPEAGLKLHNEVVRRGMLEALRWADRVDGPRHAPFWTTRAFLSGVEIGWGAAETKQAARAGAAERALRFLERETSLPTVDGEVTSGAALDIA